MRKAAPVWTLVVSIVFTLFGAWIAMHSRDGYDRWMGFGCATFFGSAAAAMLLLDVVNRGARAMLGPALRLNSVGPPSIERLELRVSPLRIVLYVLCALFCTGGAALLLAAAGLRVPSFTILLLIAFVIMAATAVITLNVSRKPPIVLEPRFLTYYHPFRRPISVWYRDIDSISTCAMGSQHFVAIKPHDVPAALAAADKDKRRRLASALRWFGAPYVLPNSVQPNAQQLIELIVSSIDADSAA